jgi:cytochrome c-type biogenesis protein
VTGGDPGPGSGAAQAPAAVAVTTVAPSTRTAAPRPPRRRAVLGTLLFVLGFTAVFASVGVAFGGLGALLERHSVGLTQVFGVLTIVLGLLFAGVFDRIPVTGRILRPSIRPRAGLAGAPMLGVLFGLSWTPCVGPTLTFVLTLSMTSGTAVRGAILTVAYGLGLGIPFLIVALAFERGVTAFSFARRHARAFSVAGGAMLVAVGVLEVTGAWSSALLWLKTHWISSYQSPL